MITCRKCGYKRFTRNKKDNKETCLKHNELEKYCEVEPKIKMCECDLKETSTDIRMNKSDLINEIYLEKTGDEQWVERNLGVNVADAYADAITKELRSRKLIELKNMWKKIKSEKEVNKDDASKC